MPPGQGFAPEQLLPPQLLQHILGLVGFSYGPAITLVCKRWHEAFYATPTLWRFYELHGRRGESASDGGESTAKLAVLRRVGSLVESAEVEHIHIDPPNAPLVLLDAAVLKHLAWRLPVTAGVLAQLTRFSELRALELYSQAPEGWGLALHALPKLASLQCSMPVLSASSLSEVARLQQLTRLELTVWSEVPPMQQLSQLSQLQRLVLWAQSVRLKPPLLASFPALGSYEIDSDGQGGRVQLGSFSLHGCSYSLEATDGRPPGCLRLAGMHSPSPLAEVLRAALPPGRPLHALVLDSCYLEGDEAMCCPELAGLSFLEVCHGDVAVHDATLCGLLSQATRLRDLRVKWIDVDEGLPPSIGMLPGLTALTLSGLRLRELPSLACLSSVEELDLSGNFFGISNYFGGEVAQGLPPALASATRLRRLRLDFCQGIKRLDEDDVSLLSSLPLLSLGLRGTALSELPAGNYLAGLTHLDLRKNNFSSLPLALSAATSLRTLLLTGCQHLRPDEENVQESLLHLPQLATLALGNMLIDSSVVAFLRQHLPALEIDLTGELGD